MNIIEIFQTFRTDEQAIEFLEGVRWKGNPVCPYCASERVGAHASTDRLRSRWQCHGCRRSFAVTVGTLFHGSHKSLREWFLVIALMLDAKKSASACQIARHTGIRRPTVWSMMQRIRAAMAASDEQAGLLHGIVEADETYVGGKPRKGNKRDKNNDLPPPSKNPRGRGTRKTPVIGAVECGGNVVARVTNPDGLSAKGINRFMAEHVDPEGTLLITDQYKGYQRVDADAVHAIINHAREYVNGIIHTNTIEGFWALVKRAWYGSHYHYSKRYMPLYIAEACYKYNKRHSTQAFEESIAAFVGA